jgi:hypothetical protein
MDTWWIDNPHLLGSRNPILADLEQLRRDGFEVLISLLKEDEQSPRYERRTRRGFGFYKNLSPARNS